MAYVLIIDDDEDFASAAAIVLKNSGYEVKIELNTLSGKASLEKRQPDLIILDVMFPEDSSAGFDLARAIRQEDGDIKDTPILMLTAVNASYPLGFSSNDIDKEWMPVEEFVEKPVDLDVLCSKVARMLSTVKES